MNKWIVIKIIIVLFLIYLIYDLSTLIKKLSTKNNNEGGGLSLSLVIIRTIGVIIMLIMALFEFPNK